MDEISIKIDNKIYYDKADNDMELLKTTWKVIYLHLYL
jgi:hypothetical protein